MPEENPEKQVKEEKMELKEKFAPITPMQEPPPPIPKEEKAGAPAGMPVTEKAAPAEAEPHEELSMRQRQQQVNQRVGLQGQELPKPRLAGGRQKAPAPLAPVAGAAKKAAKKWAKIALPLGSVGAGGILGYFLS